MDHPQIEQTILTGYPTKEYSDYEKHEIPTSEPSVDMFGTSIDYNESYYVTLDEKYIHVINIERYLVEVLLVQEFKKED